MLSSCFSVLKKSLFMEDSRIVFFSGLIPKLTEDVLVVKVQFGQPRMENGRQ